MPAVLVGGEGDESEVLVEHSSIWSTRSSSARMLAQQLGTEASNRPLAAKAAKLVSPTSVAQRRAICIVHLIRMSDSPPQEDLHCNIMYRHVYTEYELRQVFTGSGGGDVCTACVAGGAPFRPTRLQRAYARASTPTGGGLALFPHPSHVFQGCVSEVPCACNTPTLK